MKFSQCFNLKGLLQQYQAEGLSMRRRLAIYLMSALIMIMSLVLLLFNFFGILNPADHQIKEVVTGQLSSYAGSVERDYDKIAAYAISFAEQIEEKLQNHLSENGIAFGDLKDDADAINDLQCALYDTVYLNMQLAPSSGAFYILDTTANSEMAAPHYSGIYLKYINLNSDNTVNNDFSLYRGPFIVGDTNGINFHSGWQSELKTDFFETCASTFTDGVYYALSSTVAIPETWERARYVYVPIHDLKGETIGVCGFEISDLFFQLSYKTVDNQLGPMVYALLDHKEGTYSGQFSPSRFSVSGDTTSNFTVSENKDWMTFDFGSEKCVGKAQQLQLGGDEFSAAIMLTQAQYDYFVHQGQIKSYAILFIAAALSFLCCLFMSKRYVAPILKKIEQIKTNGESGDSLGIREIDDLLDFLAEKDSHYEERLLKLEKAKQQAEREAELAKAAYDRALEERQLAQSEIQQLSDEKKKEIVLEDYEFFICNLKTLTPTEYRIYELYLAGKSAKEIMEMTGIKENTLKYHNKNIYNKLGVSSRKQLLRFASLKQHLDSKGDPIK